MLTDPAGGIYNSTFLGACDLVETFFSRFVRFFQILHRCVTFASRALTL